jgi:hypothetical protein
VVDSSIILAALGAAGLAVGVAGLWTMARRSVSLHALRAIEAGRDPRESFEADVAGRLADLERIGLAERSDGNLHITRSGRFVLEAGRVLRALAGVRA